MGKRLERIHSTEYIRELLGWGFSKEFVARDAGITVESLEMRLYRAEKREQELNEHQGDESSPSGNIVDCG